MKIALITFADGPRHWTDAAQRLVKSASTSGWFSDIQVWDLARIKKSNFDFWFRNQEILNRETRGFGYWLWKPFIVLESLKTLPEDFDLLVYLDAGCSLNFKTREANARFYEYCKLARTAGGLAFQIRDQKELMWNKMDTILAVTGNQHILDTNQLVGGISIFANTPGSVALVEKWLSLGVADNYHLIDDSPSVSANDSSFVAHRHDQAIWSLLAKQSSFEILGDETYFGGDWNGGAKYYPFWATRNATGIGSVSSGLLSQILRKLVKLLRR